MKLLKRNIRLLLALFVLLSLVLLVSCNKRPVMPSDIESRIYQKFSLETVEFVYRSIVYYEQAERFLGIIPTGLQRLLFKTNIIIRAGLPLANGIKIMQDKKDSGRLYIVLPEAIILSSDLDESSIHQYYIQQSGKGLDFTLVGEEIAAIKEHAETTALEYGILDMAEQNARESLRSMFTLLGFTHIQFTTRKPEGIRG